MPLPKTSGTSWPGVGAVDEEVVGVLPALGCDAPASVSGPWSVREKRSRRSPTVTPDAAVIVRQSKAAVCLK